MGVINFAHNSTTLGLSPATQMLSSRRTEGRTGIYLNSNGGLRSWHHFCPGRGIAILAGPRMKERLGG